jgi:hypothetical protein
MYLRTKVPTYLRAFVPAHLYWSNPKTLFVFVIHKHLAESGIKKDLECVVGVVVVCAVVVGVYCQ